MSTKRSQPEQDIWKNLREEWPDDAKGPDPRVQRFSFLVESQDELSDPADPYGPLPDSFWSQPFKTLKTAIAAYEKRIKRPQTKECDIKLHMLFGGYWRSIKEVFHPNFSETYIYLVRWRSDGAFLESYHLNESKFGERNHGKAFHELPQLEAVPGLMSHWVAEAEKKKKQKN